MVSILFILRNTSSLLLLLVGFGCYDVRAAMGLKRKVGMQAQSQFPINLILGLHKS